MGFIRGPRRRLEFPSGRPKALELKFAASIGHSEQMNKPTVHASAPTKWAAIRYALSVLICAVAAAFAFNSALRLFLTIAKILIYADRLLSGQPVLEDYLWSLTLSACVSIAVAVIAWHFRKRQA
jgi:hypothetical protein